MTWGSLGTRVLTHPHVLPTDVGGYFLPAIDEDSLEEFVKSADAPKIPTPSWPYATQV